MDQAVVRSLPYSERQMVEAFESLLLSQESVPGVGHFWRIFREVDCVRGRADLVGFQRTSGRRVVPANGGLGLVGAAIIALLNPRCPRTTDFLVRRSRFSGEAVRRVLRQLEEQQYVVRTGSGSWRLGPNGNILDIRVWAFEFKLKNPRRAVFQAQQYRSFASRVLIIVPPQQVPLYAKYATVMAAWGIGLASFDAVAGSFSVETPPRARRPVSRQHQVYAIFRAFGAAANASHQNGGDPVRRGTVRLAPPRHLRTGTLRKDAS
jgi:hypothetical protein